MKLLDNTIINAFNKEVEELLNNSESPEFVDDQVDKIISKYKPLMEEQGIVIDTILEEFIKNYIGQYPKNYFYDGGE